MLPRAGVEPSVKPFADEVGEQGRRPDAREPPLSNAGALEAPPPPVAGGKLSLVSASAAAAAAAAAEAAEANGTAPSSTATVNGITQSATAEEPAGAVVVAERVISEGGGALVQAESRQVSDRGLRESACRHTFSCRLGYQKGVGGGGGYGIHGGEMAPPPSPTCRLASTLLLPPFAGWYCHMGGIRLVLPPRWHRDNSAGRFDHAHGAGGEERAGKCGCSVDAAMMDDGWTVGGVMCSMEGVCGGGSEVRADEASASTGGMGVDHPKL